MASKWKVGDNVICNGYPGRIKKIHKDEPNQKVQLTGMVDVDLARGGVCIDLKDLDRENPNGPVQSESLIVALRNKNPRLASNIFQTLMQEAINQALRKVRSTSLIEEKENFDYDYLKKVNGEYWHKSSTPGVCDECDKKKSPLWKVMANTTPEGDTVYVRNCQDCLRDAFDIDWKSPTFTGKKLNEASGLRPRGRDGIGDAPDCPKCKGDGWVSDGKSAYGGDLEKICPKCKGKGYLKEGAFSGKPSVDFGESYNPNQVSNTLKDMKEKAKAESIKHKCVQHVNKSEMGGYYVDDWTDGDNTVASYENGRALREDYEKSNPKHKFVPVKGINEEPMGRCPRCGGHMHEVWSLIARKNKLRCNSCGTTTALTEGVDRNGWKTLKTIPSHSGKARFYGECDQDGDFIGYVKNPKHINSPYSYSPSRGVLRWNGKNVIVMETKHKNYEVIEVPSGETIYKTDNEATDAYIKSTY